MAKHEYKTDPEREARGRTGIFVRAKKGDHWESVDIAQLDNLDSWLRSRDSLDWPVSVVMILLGHTQ